MNAPDAPVTLDAAESDAPTVDPHLRRMRHVLVVGVVVAVALVPLAGLAGATGEAGVAIFLLTLTLTAVATALFGSVTLVRDEYQNREIGRKRIVLTVGMYVVGAILAGMVASVGG